MPDGKQRMKKKLGLRTFKISSSTDLLLPVRVCFPQSPELAPQIGDSAASTGALCFKLDTDSGMETMASVSTDKRQLIKQHRDVDRADVDCWICYKVTFQIPRRGGNVQYKEVCPLVSNELKHQMGFLPVGSLNST